MYSLKVNDTVLAIDIGGSLTKLGLVSEEGHIICKTIFETQSEKSFFNFLSRLKVAVSELKHLNSIESNIIHLGVGAPNANPLSGNVENPPNLNWDKNVPLRTELKKAFNLPVSIANDANAAALGELYYGSAKGLKNFIVLTLGTGLGSGIIVDGKLLIGAHGAAGELGHVNVAIDGRKCNCGLSGCLETYASVTGIKRTVFELMSTMNDKSILRNKSFNEMTGEDISDAAILNDLIALRAFKITGEILGRKMADTVAHLDPETFILSGGLSKAGNILLNPIEKSMETALFKTYKGKIKVKISKATRDDAILGPAALAWLEVNNSR